MLKKVNSQVENTVIDLLVTRFDKAVRQAAKAGETQVTVCVPHFLFGQADFDYAVVQNAVKHVFENNGFRAVISMDNLIVCWKQNEMPHTEHALSQQHAQQHAQQQYAQQHDQQHAQLPAKKVVRIL